MKWIYSSKWENSVNSFQWAILYTTGLLVLTCGIVMMANCELFLIRNYCIWYKQKQYVIHTYMHVKCTNTVTQNTIIPTCPITTIQRHNRAYALLLVKKKKLSTRGSAVNNIYCYTMVHCGRILNSSAGLTKRVIYTFSLFLWTIKSYWSVGYMSIGEQTPVESSHTNLHQTFCQIGGHMFVSWWSSSVNFTNAINELKQQKKETSKIPICKSGWWACHNARSCAQHPSTCAFLEIPCLSQEANFPWIFRA